MILLPRGPEEPEAEPDDADRGEHAGDCQEAAEDKDLWANHIGE
jgi:hypothetical protein